jgi:hypothetical protein
LIERFQEKLIPGLAVGFIKAVPTHPGHDKENLGAAKVGTFSDRLGPEQIVEQNLCLLQQNPNPQNFGDGYALFS